MSRLLNGFRDSLTTVALVAACAVLPLAGSSASATTSWTLAQVPSPAGGWSAIDFLDGQWIALSHGGATATSSDGVTWTESTTPVGSWQSMAYGSGDYVALSSADVVPNEMISTNGVNWSALAGPPGTPKQSGRAVQYGQWTGIAYGHGLFVAVSAVGTVATSTNGTTWIRKFWRPQNDFTSVTYGDGRFIAVDAAQGDVLMSLDGRHWSLIRQPLTGSLAAPSGGLHFGAVAYGNGNFVAFGGSPSGAGYVATSVYGYVWSLHQYSPAQAVTGAAFGCGSFVAAGQSESATDPILSSSTGATWTATTVATSTAANWTSVAYGARQYVAVDSAGDIATSKSDADCAATVPTPPQQVSGNVHNGEIWTYMHPSVHAGAAPVVGYRVALTDGLTTKYCYAKVSFEPNCIIRGLANHQVYWVTTQARNRFGYSAPTDPEFVIPVAAWSLDAIATPAGSTSAPVVDSSTPPAVVQVTGVIANAAGIYPTTMVSVHFGSLIEACRPSPFGECVITVANPPVGTVALFATYTGYGRTYRSPTRDVEVTAT